jgi:hypothetical protein
VGSPFPAGKAAMGMTGNAISRGISEQAVDQWDLAHLDAIEPGALPDAPYHREHQQATRVSMPSANGVQVE